MRLRALRSELKRRRVEAFLVSEIKNIRYLTGFTGSSAYLVVSPRRALFLTDSRYAAQAGAEVAGAEVSVYRSLLHGIRRAVRRLRPGLLGFEGDNLGYDTCLKMRRALPGVRLRSVPGMVGRLRERKDAFELGRIRDSIEILDAGFRAAERLLVAGASERDVSLSVEYEMKRRGADALAFETIMASGARGAMPHAAASVRKMRRGEMVVVDMGVSLKGYNSDQTRTYCIGRPGALERKVHDIVRSAQARAIETIRPGVAASAVDSAARESIEKAGYAEFFGHGTGHGVGLDVHEGPVIGPKSREILREGMVVTIEPGIYLPGRFGVRIEDMVLVTGRGAEVMTRSPRELVSL